MADCELHVVGTPTPQGSKTRMPNGAMVEGSSTSGRASLAAWRHNIADACARHLDHDPHPPIAAPVHINITFALPLPKSDPHRTRHATKPDLDKLVRAVLDGLVRARIIVDDAAVSSLLASKWYARGDVTPGATITVTSTVEREAADREQSKADTRATRLRERLAADMLSGPAA